MGKSLQTSKFRIPVKCYMTLDLNLGYSNGRKYIEFSILNSKQVSYSGVNSKNLYLVDLLEKLAISQLPYYLQ